MFFWFSTPRRLLAFKVLDVTAEGVFLEWQHYQGLMRTDEPHMGYVIWTEAEWSAADLFPYQPAVRVGDLPPGEEVCRTCKGRRWETTQDFEILLCTGCQGTGRRARRETQGPSEVRRSELHPAVKETSR